VIQNPGFLPDHPQNWITGSLCHSQHTLKISEKSVHNFSSYLAHTQTDRQTKSGKNITSLEEVTTTTTTRTTTPATVQSLDSMEHTWADSPLRSYAKVTEKSWW